MKPKQVLKAVIPKKLLWGRLNFLESQSLSTLPVEAFSETKLGALFPIDFKAIFGRGEIHSEWSAVQREIEALQISEKASGVNIGDRRAIYYLMRHINPRSVLEVGTNVGASTIHIAMALRDAAFKDAKSVSLTTVDIVDVNCPAGGPWHSAGMSLSPAAMVERLACRDRVEFICRDSLGYLMSVSRKFDFIFLDGDHSASVVYREIPAAVERLNPGGYILLHDYFPESKSLWRGGGYIPGPRLAVQRLKNEGAQIDAIPLGQLPWPTKLGSNMTSLALLGRT